MVTQAQIGNVCDRRSLFRDHAFPTILKAAAYEEGDEMVDDSMAICQRHRRLHCRNFTDDENEANRRYLPGHEYSYGLPEPVARTAAASVVALELPGCPGQNGRRLLFDQPGASW